ncbi:MAG: ATP synthase F1 subunit gamma [Candidatus Doudnabacteria bacterium]|nr:ATP synthase F1 subunit gamma [Candidatus Doudnabacteria bacterium]
MATNPREIRRRIKSVKNIAQITKAMELTSAAKMRKAQAVAISSRAYSIQTGELLRRLVGRTSYKHQLIERVLPEDKGYPRPEGNPRILVILITSDRGLAGAFNSNVINKALSMLRDEGKEKFDLITVGKKGADAARRFGYSVIAAYSAKDKNVSINDARPITELAVADFLNFKYEKVFVVFSDFVSTLVQKANIIQLLPFADIPKNGNGEVLIEPGPDDVFENLVRKTIEFTVYQTLVETIASEHSARMVAMRNANEAAGELIENLTLSYNQARQAGITRELSEISAAKLAMEN